MTRGRQRALALLWLLGAAAGCSVLLRRAAVLDARIAWEVHVQGEVEEAMDRYAVRDSAQWAAGQRRVQARISALRRERGVMIGLLFASALLAVVPAAWLWRPRRRQRAGAPGGPAAGVPDRPGGRGGEQ